MKKIICRRYIVFESLKKKTFFLTFWILLQDNHWRRNEEREFMKTKSNDEVMEYNYDQYFPIIEAESIPLPNNQEYYRKVHLIGPRSPLESKMHPILNVGLSKATGIDPNSVNSVLLIPFQQVQM